MTDYSLECVKVDFTLTGQAATPKVARKMTAACGSFVYYGDLTSAILSFNPLVYFPLDEKTGTTAINLGSLGAAANGTHSGVTLNQIDAPGGTRAGLWDGGNDYTNIFSAVLAGAFSKTAGSFAVWQKVYDASVWTNGNWDVWLEVGANLNNYSQLAKKNTNNLSRGYDIRGGTAITLDVSGYNNTGFNLYVATYDETANQYKLYVNGAQYGTTQTQNGNFSGDLAKASIGASLLVTPDHYTYGYLSHAAIFSTVLTLANIQAINTAGQAAAWTTITVQRKLALAQGSLALSGQDAGVLAGWLFALAYGTFAFTGQDTGLLAARQFALAYGAFALSGQDAGVLAGWLLALVVGAFALTGNAATLTPTYNRLGSVTGSDAAIYSVTGSDSSEP